MIGFRWLTGTKAMIGMLALMLVRVEIGLALGCMVILCNEGYEFIKKQEVVK